MTRIAPSVATAIQSVLITTDLSKVSDKPLRHALAIARHYRAKLYLLNVVSSVGYTIAGPPALQMATEATTREVAKLERDLVAAGSLEEMSHEFLVREGNIWTQVEGVIREKEVGLVVTGTHGRGSLGKMLLGSVAEQIFRRADRPVLTVGPGSAVESPIENSGGMGTFLFATDFGEASLGALPLAVSFANHFGCKLVLLHVAPVAPIPESFHWSRTTGDVRKMQEDIRGPAVRKMEELLAKQERLTLEPEWLVRFGTPSKTILHVAAELHADLIVMGLNRSRYVGTAAHMPGATAYEVACGARCSVLTVRN